MAERKKQANMQSAPQGLLNSLLSLLTPSAAHAEIIPTDPEAKAIFQRSMTAEGKGGDVVRALHAQPEKFYFRSTPSLGSKFADLMGGPATLGTYRQGQLEVDTPQIRQRHDNRPDLVKNAEIDRVFQHEVGHGAADLTRMGGLHDPKMGMLNSVIQAVGLMLPGEPIRRIPREENEALADAVSGAHGYGVPDKRAEERASRVMEILKQRILNRSN